MSTLKRFPFILLLLLLAACSASPADSSATPGLPAINGTLPVAETEVPALPTATSVPMAFTVNGEGLPLEEFNTELERYRQSMTALGREVDEDQARQTVLDDLIAQVLLAQSARESGFSLDEPALQERIDNLTAQLGGADALSAWQSAHGYDEAGLRVALKRSVESAYMRDQILSGVPGTMEQVHVRQILTYNEEDAARAKARLEAGETFETVAAAYDPATRGDIGWFPRGYLELQVIEEAAFALDVNAVSEIITSEIGFHIIQVIERDPARPLAFDALLALQADALSSWLADRRAASEIIVLVQ
jgi:peptidyl-prolyl cis-trans isomerase C